MNNTAEKENTQTVVHDFDKPSVSIMNKQFIIILIIVALLGIGTGYFLASSKSHSNGPAVSSSIPKSTSEIVTGKVYGSDSSVFTDTAEGTVKQGGINGEGQYHLERPGGDSQNVYITSSTIDLSLLLNRKVKVWGQTQKAETAGWLMDVGKVQVE